MAWLVALAIGVLAVSAFHLIVGWYLAKGLHEEALHVTDRPPERAVWVTRLTSNSITLAAKGPRQDIGHPGITAIVFPGGEGVLGTVIEAGPDGVTREVKSLNGSPPICDPPLDNCEPVELNGYVYLKDPSELGLAFQETTYESDLGLIGAWHIPGASDSKWAIHVHGWTAHRQELLRYQRPFHDVGFNSLIIDYRNDDGAPRDPSGRYRFGATEWRDLDAAVRSAVSRGATEVVLSGCSTGGALVMGFLEHSDQAHLVRGVLMDSPNLSLVEAIRAASEDSRASRLMIEIGMWLADLRWRIDWEETNYVERADSVLRVPALVFHGTADRRVPISVSRRLAALVPEHVELVEVPAAGHVMSWNVDPERYEERLLEFLARL